MKNIEFIVIHHSDSDFGDVEVIRRWHMNRGWRDIGYNAVILNGKKNSASYDYQDDGKLEVGRGMDLDKYIDSNEKGAHSGGKMNAKSLGFCLIGKNHFTINQFHTVLCLCSIYKSINPEIKIIGHYEVEGVTKSCPNFKMEDFRNILNSKNYSYNKIMSTFQGEIR